MRGILISITFSAVNGQMRSAGCRTGAEQAAGGRLAGTPIGNVLDSVAEECALLPGTLVVQGAGDGRAAMLGAGILEKGEGLCLPWNIKLAFGSNG